MDKRRFFDQFRALLERRRASLGASLGEARQGMRVDEGFRPENRGERAAVTTQGYLAAGLGRRAHQLDEALELLEHVDPGPRELVAAGAWVELEDEHGRQRSYLLLPGGQGDRLEEADAAVTVISPHAPLARALRGLGEGEEASVRLDGRALRVEILRVR
jgi:transcription elongation GreA/GreB family factor